VSIREWTPPRAVVTQDWVDSELRADLADSVALEERRVFDRLAGERGQPLVLFGAGNLGRRVLAGPRRVGEEPAAFIDNSPSLWGTVVEGLTVLSPADASARLGDRAVVVVTIWSPRGRLAYPDVAAQMGALGCTRTVPFAPLLWKYQEEFLPYFCIDAPHRLYQHADEVRVSLGLIDQSSRREYLTQLSYLLSPMDSIDITMPSASSYFPRDLIHLSRDEVFVDCGAYDGDTLLSFLNATGGRFRSVLAIEPDPGAAARLRAAVRDLPAHLRKRVVVHEKAVGAESGRVQFDASGTPGSRITASGGLSVECIALDSLQGSPVPTFIKMDIEGAEADALLGAAVTIRSYRPILAVCIYHFQSDLYRLPALVHRLCPGYTLVLRRQGTASEDVVCFAIPNERRLLGHVEACG
jgi:FkbM family methyltransferase